MTAMFGAGADRSATRSSPLATLTELIRGARERMAGRSFSVDQWEYSDPIGEKTASDRRLATLGIMGRAIVVQQEMVEVLEGPEAAWSQRELLLVAGDDRYRSSVLRDDAAGAAVSVPKETVICDGRKVWTLKPTALDDKDPVHWRRMGRSELGLAELLDPSWLLRGYDLTPAGDPAAGHKAEFGGRICFELTAVPHAKSELIPAEDPCDRVDLLVDAETGVLLRLARVIDDRDYQIREWADFAPDAAFTDDQFEYLPDASVRIFEDSGSVFSEVPVLAKVASLFRRR